MTRRIVVVDAFGNVIRSSTVGETLFAAGILAGAIGTTLLGGFLWEHRGGIIKNIFLAFLQALMIAGLVTLAIFTVRVVRWLTPGSPPMDLAVEAVWGMALLFSCIVAIALLSVALSNIRVTLVLVTIGGLTFWLLSSLGVELRSQSEWTPDVTLVMWAMVAASFGVPILIWPLRRKGWLAFILIYTFVWLFLELILAAVIWAWLTVSFKT